MWMDFQFVHGYYFVRIFTATFTISQLDSLDYILLQIPQNLPSPKLICV